MQHYFNRSKVIQSIQVLFFGLILLTSPPLALSQEAPNMVNSTEAVISDMSLPHEGRPHGYLTAIAGLVVLVLVWAMTPVIFLH